MDPIATSPTALDSGQWQASLQKNTINEKTKIDQAAKQFEGILMRQFLDEALKATDGKSGLFGSSVPMYDHIIKDTLVNSITQGSEFGLSSVLQAQLSKGGSDEAIQEEKSK